MPHYRAVMATTIDCEGCKYDGKECKSETGCILFESKPVQYTNVSNIPSNEQILKRLYEILEGEG